MLSCVFISFLVFLTPAMNWPEAHSKPVTADFQCDMQMQGMYLICLPLETQREHARFYVKVYQCVSAALQCFQSYAYKRDAVSEQEYCHHHPACTHSLAESCVSVLCSQSLRTIPKSSRTSSSRMAVVNPFLCFCHPLWMHHWNLKLAKSLWNSIHLSFIC